MKNCYPILNTLPASVSGQWASNVLIKKVLSQGLLKVCFLTILGFLLVNSELFGQDIRIQQKVASVTSIQTNQYFTYTINFACDNTIDNTPCTNVILSDILPVGLELNGPTADLAYTIATPGDPEVVLNYVQGGLPDFSEQAELTLSLGDLSPGDAGVISINARFQGFGAIPDGFVATNTSTITSDNDVNPNNNSGSAMVTATAESKWEVRKIAIPGSLAGNESATEGALDNLVTYNLGFQGGGRLSNYFANPNSNAPATGGLGLYNPFIVDLLEVGLACDDIDVATTTPGFVCLAPGDTDARTGYTNSSTTQFAVVWDLDDPATNVCGPGESASNPLTASNPCPINSNSATCPEFGNQNWLRGTGFGNCPLALGVFYRTADGFSVNDEPDNTVELWGQTPTGTTIGNLGPISRQDDDTKSLILVAPQGSGTFSKTVNSFGTQTRERTFVSDKFTSELSLTNNGTIPLTNVSIVDTIPSEVSLDDVTIRATSYNDPYDLTIFFSDGSIFTRAGLINASGTASTAFNTPAGEHVDSIRVDLSAPLGIGATINVILRTTVLGSRVDDDINTASFDNPNFNPDPDPGNQLAGSTVTMGEYVTNCGGFRSDQSAGGQCAELLVGDPSVSLALEKFVDPSTPVENGDTLTFGIGTRFAQFQSFNIGSLTIRDTLPEFLEVIPGSFRLVDFRGTGLGNDATSNPNNIVITSSSVLTNSNNPNQQVVEYTVSGTSGFLDAINWDNNASNEATVGFDVRVGEMHSGGTFTNEACIESYQDNGTPVTVVNTSGRVYLNADGTKDVDPPKAGVNYQVVALPAGEAFKLSDANITPGASRSPNFQRGTPASTATFTLVFENVGNEDITDFKIVDLLPLIGDVGPTTLDARGTEFNPVFLGNIQSSLISNGVTTVQSPEIFYSTSVAPCRSEYILGTSVPFPPGCVNDFSLTPPATLSDTRALAFEFGSLEIPVGDSILISFDMQFPTPTPTGIAWNNFAWIGEGTFSGVQIGAEAPRVGITTNEFDVALSKTLNSTTQGPFIPGSTVTFDLNIFNQGELTAPDLEIVDYFDPAEFSFLSIGNPTVTTNGNAVNVTVTDTDGADGQVGFELSNLVAGDDLTVPITFTIQPGVLGDIANSAEIVGYAELDGLSATFDTDSDLINTGGSPTEVDNEIGDPINGGVDDPNDQDDFDFEQITVVPACINPTATITEAAGDCVAGAVTDNATISLTMVMNGDEAGIIAGADYDVAGGPAYGDAANIDVSGGTGSFTGLMHNTEYTIRVFNMDNGCNTDYTVTTPDLQLPTVTFTALADLCTTDGVQTGLGGGMPTGGVYSGAGVTDDGNGMTYSFDPAAAGVGVTTITYTFTDGNSCTSNAMDDVEVFATPTAAFTALADLCIDAGVQTGLGGGTPTGGVYSGAGVTDDGNGMTYSFDPVVAGEGTTTITYTVGANGCEDSAMDDVEVFALPVVNFTAPGDVCIDNGVLASLGGGTPTGGVYSGPGVTDNGNGTDYDFDPAAAGVGTHTITYTFTDGNGCLNSASDDIEVFALPTVMFTAPSDLCTTDGVQTGLGGGTPMGGVYSGAGVTDDGNGMTYSFDPAAAGAGVTTITYTFTDGNSCTSNAMDDVEVFTTPTAAFAALADLCVDAGVQAGLGGGTPSGGVYSGAGVTDDGNGMTYSFDPAAAGEGTTTITYTVGANGCEDSAMDDVEVFALPVVNFTAPGDVCIDNGVLVSLGGGTPTGGVYSGPGVTDNGNGTDYDFDPAAAGVGTHTITYTFTDGNGCLNSASDDIEVFALPTVNFTAPADLCTTDGVQTGLGGGTPMGGVYSGAGVTDDGNGMTYSFDPAAAGAGVTTITYTFTDGNSCTNAAMDDVEVFATPTAAFTAPADLCIDAGVQSGLGGGTPSGGVYSGPGVTDDGNGMTYSFDPAAAGVGSHTIIYTVGNNGCEDSAMDDVEVFALPVVNFMAPGDVCIDNGVLASLGGGTPTGGVYSGPGVTDNGNGTDYDFDPAAAGVGTHTITYTFTDGNGCLNSASDDIEVFALPIVSFTAPAELCITDGVQTSLGGGMPTGGTYSGDGVTDDGNGMTYSFDPAVAGARLITITYTFTDGNGCTDSASDDVNVLGADYGDLPDGTIAGTPDYPTTFADGGASHCVPATPELYMGNTVIVDTEADGQPDADPNTAGDGDDEDGFDITTMFVAGTTVNAIIPIVNNTGSGATLVAYADWNNNGTLNDVGEVFTVAVPAAGGMVTVPFVVPTTAILNVNLGLRFRLSTDATAAGSPTGDAPDGEVEDYFIQVMGFDYGDLSDAGPGVAEDDYETQSGNGGASHKISTNAMGMVDLKIGASVDAEADGQQNADATGDGADEDGFDPASLMFVTGVATTFDVPVMNMTGQDAKLTIYIDWDNNGDLTDVGEMYSETIPSGAGTQNASFTITPPLTANLNEPVGVRLRLTTDMAMSPNGQAPDGEVEDYLITPMGFDYGDLNDVAMGTSGDPMAPMTPADYATTRSDDGARHKIITNAMGDVTLKIGTSVDDEADGQPSANAGETGGDDNTSAPMSGDPDDEDGIDLASIPLFILTQTTTLEIPVMNMTGMDATIAVYIDFNKDGTLDATTEKFTATVSDGQTLVSVDVDVPVDAVVGQDVGMRIRLANDMAEVMTATGEAQSGEVEDYMVQIVGFDYGDLPDTYGTTDPDGPKHIVTEDLTLGDCVDSEINGLPEGMAGLMTGGDDNDPGLATFGACANGDDDEDGLDFVTPMIAGEEACISVSAVNNTGADAVLQLWIDFDGNGSFGAGEEVFFTSVNGNTIPDGGVSDALYCFDVPATATFDGGAAYVRARLAPSGGLPLAADSQMAPVPFGEIEDYKLPLAKLGNLVWEDSDYDGTQDAGEAGLEGVTVNLEWTNPLGGTEMYTTTTDANGNYYFCGLIPGTYEVSVVDPADLTPSPSNSGNDDFDDSEYPGVTVVIGDPIDLPTGEDGLTDTPGGVDNFPDNQEDISIDFAFVGIDYGDLPDGFNTTEGNMGAAHLMQDGKYLGSCVDAELDGAPIFEATGDDDTASGFSKGMCNGDDDEDGVRILTPLVPGNISCIEVTSTLPAGGGFLNAWVDYNGNDAFEANEQIVFQTDGINGVLPAGTDEVTQLCFMVPADAVFEGLETHLRFRLSCDGNLGPDGLAPDGEVEDYYQPLAKLGDFVWEDVNGNGLQDAGEPGLGGLTVTLDVLDANGNPYQATTTTDANGMYMFFGLLPSVDVDGPYKLTFTSPGADWVATGQDSPINFGQMGDDTNDSDMDEAMFMVTNITLDPKENDPTIDAGFLLPAELGDLVWLDLMVNNQIEDGLQQLPPELPVEGAKLILTGTDGLGRTVMEMLVSDANGNYLFEDLWPGDYCVEMDVSMITAPVELAPFAAYLVFTYQDAGDDALDSDVNPGNYDSSTGKTGVYNLISQESELTVDGGILIPCLPPSNLDSDNIMLTTATLSWQVHNDPMFGVDVVEHCWNIEIGGAGFAVGNGQAIQAFTVCEGDAGVTITGDIVSIDVSNLIAGTCFDFYVSETCDGFFPGPNNLGWSAPHQFCTFDDPPVGSFTAMSPNCPEASPGFVPDGSFEVIVEDGQSCPGGTYDINIISGPYTVAPPSYLGVPAGTYVFFNAGPGMYEAEITEVGICNPKPDLMPVIVNVLVPDAVDMTPPTKFVADVLGTEVTNIGPFDLPEGSCSYQMQLYVSGIDDCDGVISALDAVSASAVTSPATVDPGTQVTVTPDGFGQYLLEVNFSVGTTILTINIADVSGNTTTMTYEVTVNDNINPSVSFTSNQNITIPACLEELEIPVSICIEDACDDAIDVAELTEDFGTATIVSGPTTTNGTCFDYILRVTVANDGDEFSVSYTDGFGNVGTASTTLTVEQAQENRPPVIIAANENVLLEVCDRSSDGVQLPDI